MRLVGVIVDVSNGSECCIHRLFLVPAYPDCPERRAIKQVHCFIVDVVFRVVTSAESRANRFVAAATPRCCTIKLVSDCGWLKPIITH